MHVSNREPGEGRGTRPVLGLRLAAFRAWENDCHTHTMNSISLRYLFILALLLIAPGMPARAASSNGNLPVSAIVPPQASVSGGRLDFGIMANPTATLSANAVFQVSVSIGTPYSITLDAGLHASGDRRLAYGGSFFRPSRLYSNASSTIAWGDAGYAGSFASGTALSAIGTGANQPYTVYGISPGQAGATNPPGDYTDMITITVYY